MTTPPQDRLVNLCMLQRKNIIDFGNYGTMSFRDLKRFDKYIGGDIFGTECCIWKGETVKKYISISYKSKKISVIKLLYCNFINDLEEGDYLRNTCENKGFCCCLDHFQKMKK